MKKLLSTHYSRIAGKLVTKMTSLSTGQRGRFLLFALLITILTAGFSEHSQAQSLYYLGSDGTITNNSNDGIYKVNQDGTGVIRICDGVSVPQDMVLDLPNNRVFVATFSPTSANSNPITPNGVYKIDLTTGTKTRILATDNNFRVLNLAYDPISDYIYYTSGDGNGSTKVDNDALNRIKSDGSDNTILAKSISNTPTFLAVDYSNSKVYVFESVVTASKLMSFTLSGKTATLVSAVTVPIFKGMDFDAVNNWLYYTTDNGNPDKTTDDALWRMHPADPAAAVKLIGNLSRNPNFLAVDRIRNIAFVWNSTGGDRYLSKVNIGNGTANGGSVSVPVFKTNSGDQIAWNISNQAAAFSIPAAAKVATLSALTISSGTLSPAFSAGTTSYTVSVPYDVTSIKLRPTTSDIFASAEVAGTPVPSGVESAAYSLNTGTNTINTQVTAEDGITKKTYTVTVTRAQTPQTITFNALPAKTYGDGNFAAGATASSGLALSYASSNASVATIDNTGAITIKGAGTTNITASQAGNAIYLAATSVSQSLTIEKATLTYVADTASRKYGAANPTFTGTVTGFKNGDTRASATTGTLSFTSSANATSNLFIPTQTGMNQLRYPITGSGLSAANYTFVQAPANNSALELKSVVVTYTFRQESHAYNGQNNPTFDGYEVTFTGFVNGQTTFNMIYYGTGTTATAASGIGVYPLLLTNPRKTIYGYNYEFVPAASNATALTITKANLTFTAQPATKRYGETNPTLTGTITGFVNNQGIANLTGTAIYATPALTASNVGNYPITLSGLSSNNYTITAAPANNTALSVTKSVLTYVATPASRAFNNANPTLGGTITGFVNSDTQSSATSGTLAFNTTATLSTPVGSYTITGSGLTSNNYNFEQTPANNSAFSIYLSTNGDLSAITLGQGALSPSFNPATKNYTAEVSTQTTSITVTPTLSDANARVTVNSTEVTSGSPSANIPLVVGPNVIPVNVTAQDGTTTNPYNITVTRLPSSDAELASISSSTGSMIALPGYDYAYIDTVANNVTSVNITAVKREANAALSLLNINGESPLTSGTSFNMPLNVGSNSLNLVVTAQDGVTKNYNNVHVVRKASVNNLLSNLTVSGGLSPAFSSNNLSYTVAVDNFTTSVDFMATLADTTASFSIDGYGVASGTPLNVPLNVGANAIQVRVYAQSGAQRIYTVTVTRAQSPDATLADIGIITPGTIDKSFENDSLTYEYHVASTESIFTIKPVAVSNTAVITINGQPLNTYTGFNYTLNYFSAKEPIAVTVTSEDGANTKTFTINVVRDFSTNAFMANMYFYEGPPLSPAFDKNTFTYTAEITDPAKNYVNIFQQSEDENTEVRINGIVRSRGTYVYLPMSSGENIITASVKSFGGPENLYTIKVNRAPGITADLSGLVLSGGGYSNVVSVNGDLTYYATAPNTVTTLNVMAYASDTGAEVKINGTVFNEQTSPAIPLTVGDNEFAIVVTSADGSTDKSYTLHVNRLPFADVSLASLTINKGAYTPAFAPGTTTYAVTTANSDTTITITPVATDPTAKITVGIDTISTANPSSVQALANVGTQRLINIRVTAADGVTNRLYRFRATRATTPNAYLSSITLNHGAVSPAFTQATTGYTATVDYAVSSIVFTPQAAETGATVTVTNNGNNTVITPGNSSANITLTEGNNTITTTVSAPDNSSTRTYTVTVTRLAQSAIATLKDIDLNNEMLSPAFSSSTYVYAVEVPYTTDTISITPAATHAGATVSYNSMPVSTSFKVALPVGETAVPVLVTAQNGSTKTYTLNVTRAAPPAPTVKYNRANIFAVNTAISPLTPSVSNVAAPAYGTTPVQIGREVAPGAENPQSVRTKTDSQGNLFVVSQGTSSIKMFPANGGATVDIGSGLEYPSGLALDRTGNVYASDLNKVFKAAPGSTVFTPIITRTGDGLLAMEVDPEGNIYVADGNTSEVIKYGTDGGAPLHTFTGLIQPHSLATDGTGNIYVADFKDMGTIHKISADSGIITPVTQIQALYRIDIDPSGYLYAMTFGEISKMKIDGSNKQVLYRDTTNDVFSASPGIKGEVNFGYFNGQFIKQLRPIGGYYINKHLPAGLEFDSATGIISGTPTASSPATSYIVTAYNGISSAVDTINIQTIGKDASLTNLTLSTGKLSPVFNSDTLSYSANVANTITKVSVKPVLTDASSTVQVRLNGGAYAAVTNNTSSALLKLKVGVNIINVQVKAGDNSATKTYTINVKRLYAPTDATLAALSISDTTISPVFASQVLSYKAYAGNATDSITVKALATNPDATVTINGILTDSVTNTVPMRLAIGSNYAKVVVTSANGVVTKTYQIKISRAPGAGSGNADVIFSLRNKPKLLDAPTGPAKVNYITSVDAASTFITVTATSKELNTQVQINGVLTPRGQASAPITLTGDTTMILVASTAQNGVKKTYSIAVVKQGLNNADVALVLSGNSKLLKSSSGAGLINYVTSVDAAVASLRVTATSVDVNAKVTIQGVLTPRGQISPAIALIGDTTVINIVSTAQDGITTRTYAIMILKQGGNNADLAFTLSGNPKLIKLNSGPAQVNYIASVDPSTPLTVTAKTTDGNATVEIQGVVTARNTPSLPIALTGDTTMISIVSTAQDGVTTNTYSVAVLKRGSNNADVALVLSGNPTLTKVASSTDAQVNYVTSVSAGTSSITVTATSKDINTNVAIQGVLTPRGQASDPIALTGDTTTITVFSTAQDGISTRTYTIAVIKPEKTLRTSDIKDNISKENLFALAEKDISIYPNPFVDRASIELKGYNASQVSVNILTLQGNVVFSRTMPVNDNKVELNLSDFKQGIYIINITINGERKAYRIFKN